MKKKVQDEQINKIVKANLPNLVEDTFHTLKHVEEDFDQFTKTINFYNPFIFTVIEEYEAKIKEQRLLLFEGMSDKDFMRVLSPILVSLRDGHTMIMLSPNAEKKYLESGMAYPIRIRLIDNKLYVIKAKDNVDFELGDEIISINEISAETIISTLKNSVPTDGENKTHLVEMINTLFIFFYYTLVDHSLVQKIEYKHAGSSTILTTTIYAETGKSKANLGMFVELFDELPDPFYSVFKDEYATLTINAMMQYSNYTNKEFIDYIDNFFLEVESKGIKNVILDVRDCPGGIPGIPMRILGYLIEKQAMFISPQSIIRLLEPHFNGDLYVLTSGLSYSATGLLLSHLRYRNIGTFIGEESGGGYTCAGNPQIYRLENSQIRVMTSTMSYSAKVRGLTRGRGIMPDHHVKKTLDDYLSNQDSIMDYVIKLISSE